MIDFIIGGIVLIAVILAVKSIKNKKGSGCCSGCSGCSYSREKCNDGDYSSLRDKCLLYEALEAEDKEKP